MKGFAMTDEVIESNSEDLSDDEILRYTQRTRKELVGKITEGGMPDDNKDRALLLHALSDMDQTAINNKRLGAQQKMADADRKALMIAAKLRQNLGNRNPFESDSGGGRVIDIEPERLPDPKVVDGETDIGIDSTNYDDFMSSYED